MINESIYWKNELLDISNKLQNKTNIIKWTNSDNADFEKQIMIGFYIIRKLIESKKLTNKIISTNLKGFKYPNNGKKLNWMNNHKFIEFYSFDKKNKTKFDLQFLINLFIHSYIFKVILNFNDINVRKKIESDIQISDNEYYELDKKNEKSIIGIWVNSDSQKDDFLYEIELEKIIYLFNKVGNCNITKRSMFYNFKTNDYDIIQSEEEILISEEIENEIKEIEKNTCKST